MEQQFEEHVRCLMATSASARAVREGLILDAYHFCAIRKLQNIVRKYLNWIGSINKEKH
jgi:hypothetical protein